LYLQGLATGDFDPVLRALLGEAAPLSPTSIVRLKAQWQAEYEAWRRRPLEPRYAYRWADGLYFGAAVAMGHGDGWKGGSLVFWRKRPRQSSILRSAGNRISSFGT